MLKYNSVNKKTGKHIPPSVDAPCPTVAAQARLGIVKCNFLSKYFSGAPESKNTSVDCPAGAITTIDHHAFITAYYGRGHNHSLTEPAPTLTTKDRLAFVDMQYGNGTPSSVDNPAPTVTTNPKHQLVTVVTTEKAKKYDDWKDDFPAMVKIKQFMRLYGISDIKMRMLNINELKRIMGFPDNYVLVGTQADQKKFIGNAVEVNMARVLCEALCRQLYKYKIKAT